MKIKSGKVISMMGACGLALVTLAPVAAPIAQSTGVIFAADATYSITINKRLGTTGQVGSGTGTNNKPNTAPTANPQGLEGIEVVVTKVTPATGKAVSDMDATKPKTFTADTAAAVTKKTAADGTVKFDGLAKGYYLVHETPKAGYTAATDFIVNLPMHNDAGAVLSDVQIYPKNAIDATDQDLQLDKTLTDVNSSALTTGVKTVNAGVGATVSYAISAHVPATVYNADAGTKYGAFRLLDPLSDALTFVDDSVTGVYGDKNTAFKAADFTVTQNTAAKSADGNYNYKPFTIALTDSGLAKAAGQTVSFKFSAKIAKLLVDANGVPKPVDNTVNAFADNVQQGVPDTPATTDPDNPIDPKNPVDPTDPNKPVVPKDPTDTDPGNPVLLSGRVDLTKVDTDDKAKLLADAQFTVYTDKDAKTPLKYIDGMTGSFAGAPKAGDPVVIKTNAKGVADLSGVANADVLYLKETQAPKGYELTDQIFTATAAQDAKSDATVEDQVDLFRGRLPITGSQFKIMLMTLGSVIMITCGSVLYLRKRKESNN